MALNTIDIINVSLAEVASRGRNLRPGTARGKGASMIFR
jgi:hypothetical protein